MLKTKVNIKEIYLCRRKNIINNISDKNGVEHTVKLLIVCDLVW